MGNPALRPEKSRSYELGIEQEIGNGFVPCTRTADAFDFPEGDPVLRFLDTRGLGESGYRPTYGVGR